MWRGLARGTCGEAGVCFAAQENYPNSPMSTLVQYCINTQLALASSHDDVWSHVMTFL